MKRWLSGGITLVMVVNIVLWYWKHRKEERIRQEEFLINYLKNWKYNKANIGYSNGQIVGLMNHKDPDLLYFDEVVELLNKYNIYSLYEEGKTNSCRLKNIAKDALETFHDIIEEETKNIPLEELVKIGTVTKSYMSILRIREESTISYR